MPFHCSQKLKGSTFLRFTAEIQVFHRTMQSSLTQEMEVYHQTSWVNLGIILTEFITLCLTAGGLATLWLAGLIFPCSNLKWLCGTFGRPAQTSSPSVDLPASHFRGYSNAFPTCWEQVWRGSNNSSPSGVVVVLGNTTRVPKHFLPI